jgi:hypothetical protein
VNLMGPEAIDTAYELCKAEYEKTGQMPDIAKSLEKVEKYLASQMETTVQKWKQTKKLSNYFVPQQSQQAPNPFQAPQSTQSPVPAKPTPQPTLAGGGGATTANAATPMSRDELRAAAIKALQG